jgi:hypothetical protein
MWYDLLCARITVHIFFHTTVNTNVYLDILQEFVNPMDAQELTLGYLHQYEATSHAPKRALEGIKIPLAIGLSRNDFGLHGLRT